MGPRPLTVQVGDDHVDLLAFSRKLLKCFTKGACQTLCRGRGRAGPRVGLNTPAPGADVGVYRGMAASGVGFHLQQEHPGGFARNNSLGICSALEKVNLDEPLKGGVIAKRINAADKGEMTGTFTQVGNGLNDVFKEKAAAQGFCIRGGYPRQAKSQVVQFSLQTCRKVVAGRLDPAVQAPAGVFQHAVWYPGYAFTNGRCKQGNGAVHAGHAPRHDMFGQAGYPGAAQHGSVFVFVHQHGFMFDKVGNAAADGCKRAWRAASEGCHQSYAGYCYSFDVGLFFFHISWFRLIQIRLFLTHKHRLHRIENRIPYLCLFIQVAIRRFHFDGCCRVLS
jgi:hypothetical protein